MIRTRFYNPQFDLFLPSIFDLRFRDRIFVEQCEVEPTVDTRDGRGSQPQAAREGEFISPERAQ